MELLEVTAREDGASDEEPNGPLVELAVVVEEDALRLLLDAAPVDDVRVADEDEGAEEPEEEGRTSDEDEDV